MSDARVVVVLLMEEGSGVAHLKEALRNEGHSKVADDFENTIGPLATLVQSVMSVRNKTIAHNERELPRDKVYEIYGSTPNEIRLLIDSTCSAINNVAQALGITNSIFDDDRLGGIKRSWWIKKTIYWN